MTLMTPPSDRILMMRVKSSSSSSRNSSRSYTRSRSCCCFSCRAVSKKMTRIQTTDTVLGRTRDAKFVTTKRRVTTASSSSSSSSTGSKGFTRDDIVESFESSKASSALHNDDLSPVLKQNRTFSTFDTASLWVGLVVCVPAWQLVSSLMGIGNLSAFLALLLVFVAIFFVVWPIVLQANAGV